MKGDEIARTMFSDLAESTMGAILAYQKEKLEVQHELDDFIANSSKRENSLRADSSKNFQDAVKLKAELDKANKRIASLENADDTNMYKGWWFQEIKKTEALTKELEELKKAPTA